MRRIVSVHAARNEMVNRDVVMAASTKINNERLFSSFNHPKRAIIGMLKGLPVSVVANENEFSVLEILGYVHRLTAVSRSRRRPQSGNIMTEAPKKVIVRRLEFGGHHEIPRNS